MGLLSASSGTLVPGRRTEEAASRRANPTGYAPARRAGPSGPVPGPGQAQVSGKRGMTMGSGQDRRRLAGYGLVMAAASLWGTLGTAGRILYARGLAPGAVVTLRAAVAALVLLAALALFRPAWLRVRPRDLPYFAAFGLVSVAAYNLLYFTAIRQIPVAAAAVLLYTAPAFVAATGYLAFGEPLTRAKLAALAVTLAGCALVARAYEPQVFQVQARGLLAGLGAGFTYGMYSIFGKYGLRWYSPWVVQAYSMAAGTAALLLLYGREAARAVGQASPGVWLALAYLGLVPTLGAYSLYLTGLRSIESSHASIVATVEPVVAAVLGYAALGEAITPWQAAGMGLVLAGVAILHRGDAPGDPGQRRGDR